MHYSPFIYFGSYFVGFAWSYKIPLDVDVNNANLLTITEWECGWSDILATWYNVVCMCIVLLIPRVCSIPVLYVFIPKISVYLRHKKTILVLVIRIMKKWCEETIFIEIGAKTRNLANKCKTVNLIEISLKFSNWWREPRKYFWPYVILYYWYWTSDIFFSLIDWIK